MSFMTNLPSLADELRKGALRSGKPRREHLYGVVVAGGVARRAPRLHLGLIRCVLNAVNASMREDGHMSSLAAATSGPTPLGPDAYAEGHEYLEEDERYWDDGMEAGSTLPELGKLGIARSTGSTSRMSTRSGRSTSASK